MSQDIRLNLKQIFDLAFEYQNKKNYESARILYEKINEINPQIKNVQFNLGIIYEELNDGVTEEKGEWVSNCDECYAGELIREHGVDMEFIALDKNGKTVNANPAENLEEMFNIRSVDVKLTFRSSSPKGYFAKTQKKIVNSFTSDRSEVAEVEDRYLRDNIIVTVHTRNIGGPL